MLVGAIFCPSVCGLEEKGNEGLGPRLQMLLRFLRLMVCAVVKHGLHVRDQ